LRHSLGLALPHRAAAVPQARATRKTHRHNPSLRQHVGPVAASAAAGLSRLSASYRRQGLVVKERHDSRRDSRAHGDATERSPPVSARPPGPSPAWSLAARPEQALRSHTPAAPEQTVPGRGRPGVELALRSRTRPRPPCALQNFKVGWAVKGARRPSRDPGPTSTSGPAAEHGLARDPASRANHVGEPGLGRREGWAASAGGAGLEGEHAAVHGRQHRRVPPPPRRRRVGRPLLRRLGGLPRPARG
jgi:hypothetical protein